ncbi:MAG: hypothetical protein ACOYLB_04205 [Phototrophicaceae bacterium]
MKFYTLVLCCIFLLFTTLTGYAQDSEFLEPFSSVTRFLEAGQKATWLFSAVEGDVISLVLTSTDTLDPVLVLLSPTGARLYEVDDYTDENKNAVIEAFTIPFSGTYSIEVSGFEQSSGTYNLALYRGYAEGYRLNNLVDGEVWQSLTPNASAFTVENQSLTLIQTEPQASLTVMSETVEALSTFYAHASLTVTQAQTTDWVIGMGLIATDGTHDLTFQVNRLGQWRILNPTGDHTTDWVEHPALRKDFPQSDLAILVQQGNVEFFYNGSRVTQLVDAITVAVKPTLHLSSNSDPLVAVAVDEFAMTVPLLVKGERMIPRYLIISDPVIVAKTLERQGLIAPNGTLLLQVPESSAQAIAPGVSLLPLGRGSSYDRFILNTTVSINVTADSIAGCGVFARGQDETQYVLAYIDQTGAVGLAERMGMEFLTGVFLERFSPPNTKHTLTLIANDERILMYVTGRYMGNIPHEAIAGNIGNAVVNFGENSTSCLFENTWLWSVE